MEAVNDQRGANAPLHLTGPSPVDQDAPSDLALHSQASPTGETGPAN